ncbi:hypothetical protein LK542_07090 [Massilia sp. IC2-477]|uniref:hypothetical protein n=1 Tax=Massilia sp. IC2-477 TaxID=2887198 RepID=UPI001D108F91|nr:hypothetical protein [Massilia sp. IC2-477]MCC2955376.1 hypothetical protein [Massilia sp. IC2-477]
MKPRRRAAGLDIGDGQHDKRINFLLRSDTFYFYDSKLPKFKVELLQERDPTAFGRREAAQGWFSIKLIAPRPITTNNRIAGRPHHFKTERAS